MTNWLHASGLFFLQIGGYAGSVFRVRSWGKVKHLTGCVCEARAISLGRRCGANGSSSFPARDERSCLAGAGGTQALKRRSASSKKDRTLGANFGISWFLIFLARCVLTRRGTIP